jgi:imidazoleglycerol phosphate synthase glutamine amidotransferase subunit HisH
MQLLFESSDESPGDEGLAIIPGRVTVFDRTSVTVPQIGWNGIQPVKSCSVLDEINGDDKVS